MLELKRKLRQIDGKGYKAYKSIKGSYRFDGFDLNILRVQGDPFASPSVVEIVVKNHGYPQELMKGEGRVALEDYIYRQAWRKLRQLSKKAGSGKSGELSLPSPTQAVLPRSAVSIGQHLRLKFFVGLPAHGRRIIAKEAERIFFERIPSLVQHLLYRNQPAEAVREHVRLYMCQNELRRKLKEKGLVAFVGNGAILPRESGISDLPMKEAVPFKSPPSMEVEFQLSCGMKVKGMGIPAGVTLITGGGYHGKTTLLEAIEQGIYNHIKGDGREWVITAEDAVKIRSEDGRSIRRVDISNFIRDLPSGLDTSDFSTDDASGSTSMAASIAEAMEFGTSLILLDEDKTATNFMIKDERMEELIKREPIIPFVERVGELKQAGISTILVAGGAGEYLRVADKVILMEDYLPKDVTEEAHRIAEKYGGFEKKGYPPLQPPAERVPLASSLSPYYRGKEKVKAYDEEVLYGGEEIELFALEQIKSKNQLLTAANVMSLFYEIQNRRRLTVRQLLDEWERIFEREGFDALSRISPALFYVRRQEIGMVLNRLRKLRIAELIYPSRDSTSL